jgi:DNA-binding transcriptional LysR family regulator
VSRTTHKVELTDAGRVFLPEARRTLAAAQEARHVMQQVRGGLRGTLHLGIMLYSPAVTVSPPRLISRFVAEYPNMEFRVQTGTSGDHAEALRRGRLDLAYIALPPEDTSGLILHPLCTQTMGLVVPVGHRLADREQVELTELATSRSWTRRHPGVPESPSTGPSSGPAPPAPSAMRSPRTTARTTSSGMASASRSARPCSSPPAWYSCRSPDTHPDS